MKLFQVFGIFAVLIISESFGFVEDYGPVVKATKGAIWPKPKQQTSEEDLLTLDPFIFHFETIDYICDMLQSAMDRYKHLIMDQFESAKKIFNEIPIKNSTLRNVSEYSGLESLKIIFHADCSILPHFRMDESYHLTISSSGANLQADSVWGILRGLESFSQLLWVSADARSLVVNKTQIFDRPRFSHRGLLVDTSRHFISTDVLLLILDGMAFNKLNVFHWHMTDDQSFPYESVKYPELAKGAFDKWKVYRQDDIALVINQARLRGIRVIPEFDTPGHTRSWGASHPELLTKCSGVHAGKLGPIDPSVNSNFDFVFNLTEEIVQVFPDKFIHLGGDEVDFTCWESNQNITDFMKASNITKYAKLEEFYILRLINKIRRLKSRPIVWQEVYTNGAKLPKGTVVQMWLGNIEQHLYKITRDGFPVILSACWYLDQFVADGDWIRLYQCDPHNFPGINRQKKLIYGGEAAIWGEFYDDSNILQRIFPRVSATAEKLWSERDADTLEGAAKRLEEHYCRMRRRKVPAQPPNGPGFCLY